MNNCSIAKGDDLKYAALRLQSLFIIHHSSFIPLRGAEEELGWRRGQDRSPTGCGIGLTDCLAIGLAPAFLIRRFAPPYPFAVPCGRLAAEAAALPTDRYTRLCSASSATGSAEQRGPKGKVNLIRPRHAQPPCPFAVPCGRLAAEAAALPTDRCTRLCSACSAAGSAEQRGHTGGPRRLFGYFLAGEKVSLPLMHFFCGGRPILQARQKHP